MGERPRLDCEPRAEPTAERMTWSRKLIANYNADARGWLLGTLPLGTLLGGPGSSRWRELSNDELD
jgi:hypothetical protein